MAVNKGLSLMSFTNMMFLELRWLKHPPPPKKIYIKLTFPLEVDFILLFIWSISSTILPVAWEWRVLEFRLTEILLCKRDTGIKHAILMSHIVSKFTCWYQIAEFSSPHRHSEFSRLQAHYKNRKSGKFYVTYSLLWYVVLVTGCCR